MKEYADAGVHETFYRASQVIREVGFTRHMHCDPTTGAVDVEGAILLALGARQLPVMVEDAFAAIPETSHAAYMACLGLLESEVGDLTNWVDRNGNEDSAIKLLVKLGDEVSLASC